MSKKFYAVDRLTGKRWEPKIDYEGNTEFLMMYDSGYLAVVKDCGYDGHSVKPLDNSKWKTVIKDNIKK